MKILIVDHHADSREGLFQLCRRNNDIHVAVEADCGRAAMDAASTFKPDILLVNVNLPDMSGFELLRALGAGDYPLVIMLSPCADHAIRAFAEGAIDYLVTPVTAERFDLSLARGRHRCNAALRGSGGAPAETPELSRTPPMTARFLVGERQRRLYPLDPKSIDYIEADGNYVTLRAGKVEYLSRDSIKRLSLLLAEFGFVRIDRSLLVNAAAVLYVEIAGHGTFALTLASGVCVHSSAAYRDSILRIIPLPSLSKRYRGTSTKSSLNPISEKEGFVTLSAQIIPK